MPSASKTSTIEQVRHSLAHLLAMAVLKKFPKAKLGIGPTIENGFYYDFLLPRPISPEDLKEFEGSMRDLISTGLPFSGEAVTPGAAKKLFKDQPFKLDLIQEFVKEKKQLTVYYTGEKKREVKNKEQEARSKKQAASGSLLMSHDSFLDLCRGGHVNRTSDINPDGFMLEKIAGAYWRGNEKNKQLTRIYGLAFPTREELEAYQRMLIEMAARDHRKLGKELELFHIADEVGPGLPLFYPKGAMLRRTVETYVTELQEKKGYVPIWIPHITKGGLYETSGHLDKYDAMYPPMKLKGEADYYLKPMNCPHFMVLYKSIPHSYRDLPVRYTATTTNYRYEKSGELSGLTRVRSLTQDDCHVFCTNEQVGDEIHLMLETIEEVYAKFGLNDFWVRISTRDPKNHKKYIGDTHTWDAAEATLKNLIAQRGWRHDIGEGEAAFYGPKLDFIFKDVLGREWQLSTVQLDMNLPHRFGLAYTTADGAKSEPVLIHRAILGSTERFLGILIEHFAGAFPFWLAPVQIALLPINDKVTDYTKLVTAKMREKGFRVTVDDRNETIGKKIREAELQKIPYLLVIGEREAGANTVAVRERGKGDRGAMPLDAFMRILERGGHSFSS